MDLGTTASGHDSWEACTELLEHLPSLGPAERAEAVFRLVRNPSPGIRLRALRVGAALLPEPRMVECLREQADDVLRNSGLEMLKLRGPGALPTVLELLRDPDPDVVLQAVLLVDHYRDPRAVEPLRPALHHPDPNVIQAALTALGRLGDSRIIPDLVPFLKGDAWLQIAAIQALGDIKAPAGAKKLEALLPDLFAGPFAAEALARMGGAAAFKALVRHWMQWRVQVDTEPYLGFLTHVACGLKGRPALPEGFLESVAEVLQSGPAAAHPAAAHCLLALGPSPWDAAAVEVLADRCEEAIPLPPSLQRRGDLCDSLLAREGTARDWGMGLAADGAEPSEVALQSALCGGAPPSDLDAVSRVARRLHHPWLGEALLDLYLQTEEPGRLSLVPALKAHAAAVLETAGRRPLPGPELRVLEGRLGEDAQSLAAGLEPLGKDDRLEVLRRLADSATLVKRLPWKRWIESDPQAYGKALARAAVASRWGAAAELLRPLLEASPEPELLRALGELGDRKSVPTIAAALNCGTPLLRIQAMESLGRIGDPASRSALVAAAAGAVSGERRALYRALALSATEEEVPLFRAAAADPDWMVRLACAEVFGRFPTAENLAALYTLASDPSAAVAQRAQAALEA